MKEAYPVFLTEYTYTKGNGFLVYVPELEIHTEAADLRSEERRVGKECRSRWSPYH